MGKYEMFLLSNSKVTSRSQSSVGNKTALSVTILIVLSEEVQVLCTIVSPTIGHKLIGLQMRLW